MQIKEMKILFRQIVVEVDEQLEGELHALIHLSNIQQVICLGTTPMATSLFVIILFQLI